MAKNPFWLRGAQGKFAGAVVQKGADGGTIIRENVKPRNPRTMSQMLTRLAFAVVNQAAAAFDSLVNHAFEGVKVGKDSRRRFVAVNVSRIKAYAQQQMNDASLVDLAAFNPKGLSIPIPNKLIISRGSISRSDPFRIVTDNDPESETYGQLIYPSDKQFEVNNHTTMREFLAGFGFKPADELSVAYVRATQENSQVAAYGIPEFGKGVRPAAFAANRIVFLGSDETPSVEGTPIQWDDKILAEGEELTVDFVTSRLYAAEDHEKTSPFIGSIINNHIEVKQENGKNYVVIKAGRVFPEVTNPIPVLAAQTIVSRYDNGVERRSNEDLATTKAGYADGWFGLSFNEAVQTYLTSSSYNSDLFLDQGGDNTLGDGGF